MSKASKRKIEAVEHEAKALELRLEGKSFRAIGEALDLSHEGARQACLRGLRRLADESRGIAAELRALEDERLTAMLAAVWPKAKAGDLDAIDRVLRLGARRAKLWGLDAPKRYEEIQHGEQYTDEQIALAAQVVASREDDDGDK